MALIPRYMNHCPYPYYLRCALSDLSDMLRVILVLSTPMCGSSDLIKTHNYSCSRTRVTDNNINIRQDPRKLLLFDRWLQQLWSIRYSDMKTAMVIWPTVNSKNNLTNHEYTDCQRIFSVLTDYIDAGSQIILQQNCCDKTGKTFI